MYAIVEDFLSDRFSFIRSMNIYDTKNVRQHMNSIQAD